MGFFVRIFSIVKFVRLCDVSSEQHIKTYYLLPSTIFMFVASHRKNSLSCASKMLWSVDFQLIFMLLDNDYALKSS